LIHLFNFILAISPEKGALISFSAKYLIGWLFAACHGNKSLSTGKWRFLGRVKGALEHGGYPNK